jgi:hypothetical protein
VSDHLDYNFYAEDLDKVESLRGLPKIILFDLFAKELARAKGGQAIQAKIPKEL